MSGAYGRGRCCGPVPPLSNTTLASFLLNTSTATPLVFQQEPPAPQTATSYVAESLNSLAFALPCESNVTLTFPGTIYLSGQVENSVLQIRIVLRLAGAASTTPSIIPSPYQVPPLTATIVSGIKTPFTAIVPIVLPAGSYTASIQVTSASSIRPPGQFYLDGVMYAPYVRTYV